VNTAPDGDAMTVRFPREAPKRGPVPWPVCWRIHAADAARFTEEGKHCDARRCREPIAMATWRYWQSTAAGRVLLAEHVVCVQHGRAFAERHGIEIEPPPAEPSRRRSTSSETGGPR
jgi:hypothetical protein